MKIVNIIGGLGNQMFQYAFAVALKKENPDEMVYLDTHHFNYLFVKKYKTSNLHNGYELEKLFSNIDIEKAPISMLMKVTNYIPNFFLSRVARKVLPKRHTEYVAKLSESQTYIPGILSLAGNVYYEGYWQVAQYYINCREELHRAFVHPMPNEYNARLIKEITNSNSVGIHVRRGNYLLSPTYSGICNLEYYKKAIARIMGDGKQHRFYIFSNDINWCQQNIVPLLGGAEVRFVTENTGANSCWDMFLMSYCHDLIMANSSFSWWGAFLNNNVDRVIAPHPWMNGRDTSGIYVPEWIKVDC